MSNPALAAAFQPKVLANFVNPSALPMSQGDKAGLLAQMAGIQAQKDIAQGNLGFNQQQLQQQKQQDMMKNQVDTAKLGMDAQRLSIESAKAEAEIRLTDADYKSKALEFQKSQALINAAQQGGIEGYMSALQNIDPERFATMKQKQADLTKTLVGTDRDIFQLSKDEQLQTAEQFKALGTIAQNILLAGPNAGNLYDKSVSAIRKIDPNAPSSWGKGGDDYIQAASMTTASFLDSLAKSGGMAVAAAPEEVKQGMAAQINQMVQSFDPAASARAKQAYMRGDAAGANAILNEDPDKMQKQLYKETKGAELQAAQGAATIVPAIREIGQEMLAVIDKSSDLFEMGPIVGNVSPLLSENAQLLKSLQGKMVPLMRQLLQFPASGFSEGDRKMLEDAAGGVKMDKATAKKVIEITLRGADNAEKYFKSLKEETFGKAKTDNPYAQMSDDQIKAELAKRGLK